MITAEAINRAHNGKRARYDEKTIHDILDKGLVAHVGFIVGGRPVVMPMAYAREGDVLYLHGASKTRIVRATPQEPVCVTVTLIDGLVAARSGFHHSVNYRSGVVHGTARAVTDADEHDHALQLITEHLLPGRYEEIRPMTAQERKATGVIALTIEAASAKVRDGGPRGRCRGRASGPVGWRPAGNDCHRARRPRQLDAAGYGRAGITGTRPDENLPDRIAARRAFVAEAWLGEA